VNHVDNCTVVRCNLTVRECGFEACNLSGRVCSIADGCDYIVGSPGAEVPDEQEEDSSVIVWPIIVFVIFVLIAMVIVCLYGRYKTKKARLY
jgi:heme/copper-type cytochrome/quinol oxidase subunit 2